MDIEIVRYDKVLEASELSCLSFLSFKPRSAHELHFAVTVDGGDARNLTEMVDGLVDVLAVGDADGNRLDVVVAVDDLGTVGRDGLDEGDGVGRVVIGDDKRGGREHLVL